MSRELHCAEEVRARLIPERIQLAIDQAMSDSTYPNEYNSFFRRSLFIPAVFEKLPVDTDGVIMVITDNR